MCPKWRCVCVMMLAAVVTGAISQTLFGQAASGTITGFVTDPSDAAVPGATVAATNVRTGVETKTTTSHAGLYSITNLIPGTYTITVTASGFQKSVQENVLLEVDSTATVNARLVVGTAVQSVTVSSAAPLLKAEKTDVSQVLPQTTVMQLPILGENSSELAFLSPGTVPEASQNGPGENPSLGSAIHANGQFWGTNEFQLDGITDVQFGSEGMQIINPPVDSIQELKVTTSNYDAEIGQVGGVVLEYVTKSGTDQFHGSLFAYNRNSDTFAANPYSEKIPGTGPEGKGTGPAYFNYNQGGGSIGGPIKKEKMFFFGDYQFTRTIQGYSALATVPTAAIQGGNLNSLLGPYICNGGTTSTTPCTSPVMVPTTEGGTIAAQQNMIFDPTTGNPDGSGREAFTVGGIPNIIPANRINPVATNLLNLLNQQTANRVINQQAPNNNLSGSTAEIFNQNEYDDRYDWNISDKDKVFARYSYMGAYLNNPGLFGLASGPAAGGLNAEFGNYRNQLGALNFTRTLSPTLLAEGRLGLTRMTLLAYPSDQGHDLDNQVGIQGVNTSDPITEGLAGITVGGPTGEWDMGSPSGAGIPRLTHTTIIQAVNNWTWMRGSHAFRWGVDFRRQRFDYAVGDFSTRGNFEFNNLITGDANVPNTGLGDASFLLGMPYEYDRSILNQTPAERETRIETYFQDDWHVTPKLVLNLGLRWTYMGPSTPHFTGGGVNFDPATGDLVIAGLGSVSRSSDVRPIYDDFGPRFGFAYNIMSKTVIRGGFGRSYFASNYGGGPFLNVCCSYPVQTRQQVISGNYFPIPNSSGANYTLSQPVPAPPAPIYPASGILPVSSIPGSLNLEYMPFDDPTSYVDTWNLTVQHQFRPNTSVTVAYVGNVGRHLFNQFNPNTPVPGPGNQTANEPYASEGVTATIAERCKCLPSNYNGLEVTADKRFGAGYSILSSYTWSKAMDRETGGFGWTDQNIDPFDFKASYGIEGNDRADVWTLAHIWNLPYGSGRKWGSSAPKVQQAILGGWVFNGITTVMSGFPTPINWADNGSLNSTFGQRPDLVPGCNPAANIPSGRWYNPACFQSPALRGPYLFGDYGRNSGQLRGPGWMTADLALGKDFNFKTPLNEATKLEFRWDAFNAFNNTNRGFPDTNADDATAGVITSLMSYATMRRMQFTVRLSF